MPGRKITGVTISDVDIRHPGGGNKMYADVPLKNLETIPELPAIYPDFLMFKELPASGMYMRHAAGVTSSDITLSAGKKDYRVPVVLDDVHEAGFTTIGVNKTGDKDVFHLHNSTGINTGKTAKGNTKR